MKTPQQFERFGRMVWKDLSEQYPDISDEGDDELMEMAGKCGLASKVFYNPAIHGVDIDADPGEEIWFWGDEKTKGTECDPK